MKTFFLMGHLNSGKIAPIKSPKLSWIVFLAADKNVRAPILSDIYFYFGGEDEGLDCILFKNRNHKEDG